MINLNKLDGTGRLPRPEQLKILEWINNTKDSKFLALQGACGIGKQFIAKTIMNQYRTSYLTSNNLLIAQFLTEYPDTNKIIGRHHYTCNRGKESVCPLLNFKSSNVCEDCIYYTNIQRGLSESTCFNPLSYYFMTKRTGWTTPEVLIIDEAHTFISSIISLASIKLPKSIYDYPITKDPFELLNWLDSKVRVLEQILKYKSNKTPKSYDVMYDKLIQIRNIFQNHQNEYTWYEGTDQNGKEYLYISPIDIPSNILSEFLKAKKILIMSGTLTQFHIKEVFNTDSYSYLDIDDPIPIKNRPIIYKPFPLKLNRDTNIEFLAKWLKKQIQPYMGMSTIIHVTYNWSNLLKPYFPTALVNTPKNKQWVLKQFKKKGGIWLASGCSEGIDLPDDSCRLNITLRLPRANLKDDRISKRRALPNGEKWYDLETLNTYRQQVSRSNRHINDYSINIIADPLFKSLILKYKEEFPSGFLDSINF